MRVCWRACMSATKQPRKPSVTTTRSRTPVSLLRSCTSRLRARRGIGREKYTTQYSGRRGSRTYYCPCCCCRCCRCCCCRCCRCSTDTGCTTHSERERARVRVLWSVQRCSAACLIRAADESTRRCLLCVRQPLCEPLLEDGVYEDECILFVMLCCA